MRPIEKPSIFPKLTESECEILMEALEHVEVAAEEERATEVRRFRKECAISKREAKEILDHEKALRKQASDALDKAWDAAKQSASKKGKAS